MPKAVEASGEAVEVPMGASGRNRTSRLCQLERASDPPHMKGFPHVQASSKCFFVPLLSPLRSTSREGISTCSGPYDLRDSIELTIPRAFFRRRKREPSTPHTSSRFWNGFVSKLKTPPQISDPTICCSDAKRTFSPGVTDIPSNTVHSRSSKVSNHLSATFPACCLS